ncbi:MAG: ABC transporter ATP-binding protein [Clostridia bacterium]|nr:ABC transporter ATP-binding protein [Clostridia bacterium]
MLVRASALHKAYGTGQNAVKALDGVDLDIYQGELLVILGSSGSGKSTLLNMLGGMDKPDSGQIRFRDREITRLNDRGLTDYRRRNVGFIFQSFNLIAELTARENVALTADTSRDAGIVDRTLDMLGLSEKKNNYPAQMSGGQQQRTAIARALAGRAELLLCDEPTGALDYDTGKQILIQLEALARREGKTVVIVTHTQEIGKMADRVIRMRDGRVIAEVKNEEPVPAESIEW